MLSLLLRDEVCDFRPGTLDTVLCGGLLKKDVDLTSLEFEEFGRTGR